MQRSLPPTKDLLQIAEATKVVLDEKSQKQRLVYAILAEAGVIATGYFVNKTAMLLIGVKIISNPLLLGLAVGAGVITYLTPKIIAYKQRKALLHTYAVASDHIDYTKTLIGEVLEEVNKSNKWWYNKDAALASLFLNIFF